MILQKRSAWVALTTMYLAGITGGHAATPIVDPKPQAYSTTCQSYSIAYALSASGLPDFTVATFSALRRQEIAIRDVIERVANSDGLPADSHEVWRDAVRKYTHGELELKVEYAADEVKFLHDLRRLTNSWDARESLGVAYFGIARPVMTSVVRVGRSSYGSGHILTILGVDYRPVSPTPIAVLNSAIKYGNSLKSSCDIGDLGDRYGDQHYTAKASVITNYQLKRFPSGYLIMYVEKR